MPDETYKLLILGIIFLLVIWLIYRIKNKIRLMVRNEIYNDFPSIKNAIDNFEHRIDYLKTQIEGLEEKIKELTSKITK